MSLGAAFLAAPNPSGKPKTEFNRDIRPILSKCLTCHGHDASAQMAGLRLDKRDGAVRKLPSGNHAIVPGKPDQSELIKRVFAEDEEERMPPPSSHKTLSSEEKNLLREWIAEGAIYKEHWAFVRPVRPVLPPVRLKSWPRNPIDNYVLAQLEEKGLKPSPQADRRTLIRRVSLDLTGLPPTPQEVDAFLSDKSPQAYDRVVDRLLASPRYGERMAMDWMDYARYADSNGYQADYERFQWRWRDWVIDAFNKNMPYDQFTVEQLAGDMLPNATLDQKLATGFNRNHRINTEGGVIAEEWRIENVIDRVETTSTVWLGLTTGCARCHDHKYDPVSQKEFYSFFAYFNNVPESGTGEERPVNHPPLMSAPYPEQTQRLKELSSKLAVIDKRIKSRLASRTAPDTWAVREPPRLPTLKEGLIAQYRLDKSVSVAAGTAPLPRVVDSVKFDTGRSSGAVVTSDKGYVDLGDIANFDTREAFSFSVWVNPDNGRGAPVSRMDAPNNFRGWDLYMQDGRPSIHIVSKWPSDALKVISKTRIPNSRWSHVAITYDGSAKAAGVRIYVNGQLAEPEVETDRLSGSTRTTVSTKIGRRTGADNFFGKVDDLMFYGRALTAAEAKRLSQAHEARPLLAIPVQQRSEAQRALLKHLWALDTDTTYRTLDVERRLLTVKRDQVKSEITTVMVMEEMPKPRDTYVLIRGQYDKRGEKVTAGLPAALPPLPKGTPNNRLGLAKWIVDLANPLTPRVTVNRMWERLFGAGIVSTTEDFGTRAAFPSHPELLDWLATEFVRLKWDQKAMWRLLVTSATYRQSSKVTPQLLRVDPTNRLLARGPRFRLPGEVIRDQALAVSGLLVEKIGGRSVRPYQPDGVWDELNVYGNLRNYKHDKDSGLHRRSLYTIWKRTAAPPNMTLFDVPSREACRVQRARTNTPLQALALLNDVTYLEAARALAEQMLLQGGSSVETKLSYAYRKVLGRTPTGAELAILRNGLAKRLSHYRANPEAATKLVMQGEVRPHPKLEHGLLAAYTIAASTILNLDETLTKE